MTDFDLGAEDEPADDNEVAVPLDDDIILPPDQQPDLAEDRMSAKKSKKSLKSAVILVFLYRDIGNLRLLCLFIIQVKSRIFGRFWRGQPSRRYSRNYSRRYTCCGV